jgi:hypothetical protein
MEAIDNGGEIPKHPELIAIKLIDSRGEEKDVKYINSSVAFDEKGNPVLKEADNNN